MKQQFLLEQQAVRQQAILRQSKHLFYAVVVFATIAMSLSAMYLTLSFSEPAPLPKQNIQVIQCMDTYGNLQTHNIHIPLDSSDPADFIAGFCQSL